MAESDEPEKIWDEYDWERFLQQQDRKTEKYMELLERYIDDPNRDQIIAREMGWYHLLDRDGEQWAETVDSTFEDGPEAADEDCGNPLEEEQSFEVHPLYQASFALTVWIDQYLERLPGAQSLPSSVKLSTNASVASAKLAAALSDDDVDEIGMTIAYLKRALKAIMCGIDAAVQLRKDVKLSADAFGTLNQRLFQIRDGIIQLMGEYRAEWRRRYNHE